MNYSRSNMIFLLLVSVGISAQDGSETSIKTIYGVSVTVIGTGTGHGLGYTLNGNVTNGRKSLEAGLIFCDRESKIDGLDIKYRIFLGNLESLQSSSKIYKAYLHYNLVLQKGMSYSPQLVTLGDETYLVESEPGKVATFGHYLGFGNELMIFRQVYLDASLGFGYYKGSLDKVNGPGTFGIHYQNSGYTYSIRIGIGILFN